MSELNEHSMITRSKKKELDDKDIIGELTEMTEEINENGDLSDIIDTSCNAEFDNEMFQKEISRLRGKTTPLSLKMSSPKKSKKKKKKHGSSENLIELLSQVLLVNMFMQNSIPKGKKSSLKKKKSNPSILDLLNLTGEDPNIESGIVLDVEEDVEDDVENDDEEEDELEEDDIELEEDDIELEEGDIELEDEEDDEEEEDDEDEEYEEEMSDMSEYAESQLETSDEEYDEYDDKFIEMVESDINEDVEIDYFRGLDETEKVKHLKDLEDIKDINNSNVPMKFKILNSDMDIKTKSIAIENINKLNEMDVSTGEYCKMDKWINGLIKIPFGKYTELPINNDSSKEELTNYLINTQRTLDKAIFGHKDAKMHILQVLGKWIRNPKSHGNVLALQGPMGNGKTTLVKEGIAKAINRPFAFIALGGASDSSYFDGHSYTYEGSHWGRIIDILIDSKCMNPVIYFDELDKISETHKGEEITHLLTHLTDPSQNSLFQDNYFPGIHLNLSKALFIFSFNDESRIDRILKDRMYVINTKGFKPDDKLLICKEYIIPEILDTYLFEKEEIEFTEESIRYIIENYTMKEEGVRNLKRCLETIVSKINIYNLCNNGTEAEKVSLNFEIKDFTLPIKITEDIVKVLVTSKEDIGKPPEHMYM
uniref:Uncharacterized protein n=1 Tax=viral metagenome TaxID=1070528 RepID=A0A6C0FAZ9_9ZZZZ|tara:strand:- start:2601 stop:4556 length:1956 start_codon:yes stop_codon:yes gene_type:complete